MQYIRELCSAVQCSAVQYISAQRSAVQFSAVQFNAVQFSSVQGSSRECSSMQCSTEQNIPVCPRMGGDRTIPSITPEVASGYRHCHCTILHNTALHFGALKCTTLHSTTLHFGALHCTALFNNTLQQILLCPPLQPSILSWNYNIKLYGAALLVADPTFIVYSLQK